MCLVSGCTQAAFLACSGNDGLETAQETATSVKCIYSDSYMDGTWGTTSNCFSRTGRFEQRPPSVVDQHKSVFSSLDLNV